MSGYSKFVNIERKKERDGAIKGKIFTVTGHEIAITVGKSGAGPANNGKLRDVITKVRANSVLNDTIDRGIGKAVGDTNSVNYEVLTCEGYGPSDVAIIVDALADSRNRTAANMRSAFMKGDGNVDTPGNVPCMFDRRGQIIINKEECDIGPDELVTFVLDMGAKDFSGGEDNYEVAIAPEDFSATHEALEAQNIPVMQADIIMILQT